MRPHSICLRCCVSACGGVCLREDDLPALRIHTSLRINTKQHILRTCGEALARDGEICGVAVLVCGGCSCAVAAAGLCGCGLPIRGPRHSAPLVRVNSPLVELSPLFLSYCGEFLPHRNCFLAYECPCRFPFEQSRNAILTPALLGVGPVRASTSSGFEYKRRGPQGDYFTTSSIVRMGSCCFPVFELTIPALSASLSKTF